jgi:hypothetical protein
MITLDQYGNQYNIVKLKFVGLSTDTKPTTTYNNFAVANGSFFYEIDTGKGYCYDAQNVAWDEIKNGASLYLTMFG